MTSGVFWGQDKQKEATTTIIILALYFSDPFLMFLVRDHLSCKHTSNKGRV